MARGPVLWQCPSGLLWSILEPISRTGADLLLFQIARGTSDRYADHVLRMCFSCASISQVLVTDNGHKFCVTEMKCQYLRAASTQPCSNGAAENLAPSANNALESANLPTLEDLQTFGDNSLLHCRNEAHVPTGNPCLANQIKATWVFFGMSRLEPYFSLSWRWTLPLFVESQRDTCVNQWSKQLV